MSVQDDKDAGQEEGQQMTEKPEPDEEQKEKAAEMMTAYEDRPTLVLPGTSGMVSGTAVNDWLDDEGNPKGDAEGDTEARAENQGEDRAENQGEDEGDDNLGKQEQIDKDKAFNEELREAAKQENKGEKR
ncbi:MULTISPECIES: hypothetical protein [unclassified Mycobacterium]|uniref:hypothetical protein n=1 Tax=unclassified Mycobacterium TaxID=2642494 RepID=UPI00096F2ADE|nr:MULTISPECIES: hypothetical protein [unclassified Mycobacterium]OMC19048.1 hypothetical protein A5736_13795 [Mycobacterium sp. SP-6446]OMC57095.1 hypothetical protein A5747_04695 [Mycobacterium sp. IS-836]